MTSLKRPSRAIYRINGRDAQRIPDDIRTRYIRLVRQGAPLTEGTVMEIIKWPGPRDVPDSWVHKVCDVAQIHKKISQLPQGYQSVIGERSILLSSGERQRIALARALAHRPRLLVMDEATSQLDSATTRQVLEGIRDSFWDTTIVMVTHQMFAVERVDTIIVMRERRNMETGKHEALMRIEGGVYKNLWENQEPRSCHAGRDIA
jgi:ATP-binding cassette subfamily B protein